MKKKALKSTTRMMAMEGLNCVVLASKFGAEVLPVPPPKSSLLLLSFEVGSAVVEGEGGGGGGGGGAEEEEEEVWL